MIRCVSGGAEDNQALAQLLGPSPEGVPCLVAYAEYYEAQAAQEVARLLGQYAAVWVYKLPATLETLMTSQVLSVSWEAVMRERVDGWVFVVKRIPVEHVLEILARRRAAGIREVGEFDRVIAALAKRHHIRRSNLRMLFGRIWRQLYPDKPIIPRKRYPWWRHLKKNGEYPEAR